MKDIEKTAVKYGAKFDDDIATQVIMVNDLDRIAGASAKTGLQGQMEAANMMGKSKIGLAQDAVKAVRNIGKDTEKALDLMEEYLKKEPSAWE